MISYVSKENLEILKNHTKTQLEENFYSTLENKFKNDSARVSDTTPKTLTFVDLFKDSFSLIFYVSFNLNLANLKKKYRHLRWISINISVAFMVNVLVYYGQDRAPLYQSLNVFQNLFQTF